MSTQEFSPEFQELETFLRAEIRQRVALNEPGIRTIAARLSSLARAGFDPDRIRSWVRWRTQEVIERPNVKNPGALLSKILCDEDPSAMPQPSAPKEFAGHSPAPNFLHEVRSNAAACDEERYPPILLIQGRGRIVGDYQQALVDVEVEYTKQGRPLYHELDLAPFEQGGPCEVAPLPLKDFKEIAARLEKLAKQAEAVAQKAAPTGEERWQDRRVRERAEQDARHGPRRHPYSISQPLEGWDGKS